MVLIIVEENFILYVVYLGKLLSLPSHSEHILLSWHHLGHQRVKLGFLFVILLFP